MANNNEQVKWEEFFEEGSTQTDTVPAVLVAGQGKGGVHKRLEVTTRLYSDGRHKVVYLLKVRGWGVIEHYESSIALEAYNEA